MNHNPAYSYIPLDVEELLQIGGNAAYAHGVLLFDNLGESSDTMMWKSLLFKMLIKPKMDIVVICISGELNYMLDSSRPIRLQGGQFAYFSQDLIVEINERLVSTKIIMIAFPHEMTIGIRELDTDRFGLSFRHYSLSDEKLAAFRSVYGLMRQSFENEDQSYRKEIIQSYSRILMMQLSDIIRREREKSMEDSGTYRPRREMILYHDFTSIVKEEYTHHRDIGYYAGRLCISPEHLSRIVKAVSGRSASQWIRDYVVLEAKILLKSTDMTVSEIGNTLNFPNPSFFNKFFRKSTGMTPGTYRSSGS